MKKRNIAILGATGSIGTQALDVVAHHPDMFEVDLLTANNNAQLLIEQALKFKPNNVKSFIQIFCNTWMNNSHFTKIINRTRIDWMQTIAHFRINIVIYIG